MELQKGVILGNYKIDEFKGKGSTAEVWSGIHIETGIKYALKIFAPDIALDKSSKRLLKHEYNKTKKLNHPYIINPIDHFEEDGRPILVFRLCNHSLWEELRQRIAKRLEDNNPDRTNIFSEKELAQLLFNISNAMVYLHKSNMIHHDIKPANILIDEVDGKLEYFLSDFGITKEVRETIIRQTKARSSSLTLAYAAPERLRGDVDNLVDSDIFSLGASIYELTNSIKIPPGEILNNNGNLEDIKGDYSDRIKNMINKCLEKDYTKRPSAEDIYKNSMFFLKNGYWPESLGLKENQLTKVQVQPEKQEFQDDNNPRDFSNTDYSDEVDYSLDKEVDDGTSNSKSFNIFKILKFVAIPIVLLLTAYFAYSTLFIDNDVKGKIICKNGFEIIQTKNNMCGLKDKNGNWVKNPIYNKCINMNDSIILISDDERNVFLIK